MSRAKPASVEIDRQKRDFNTWRLLVRHPEFLKDLVLLRNQQRVPQLNPGSGLRERHLKWLREIEKVADKWGLTRFPSMALDPLRNDAPKMLEAYYLNQRDQQGPYPVTYPIVAVTELKEDRFLYCWVDTNEPVDKILAAIEAELRQFYRATKTTRKRGRSNDLDFQLKVFDLVNGTAETSGMDFKGTARKLHQPRSRGKLLIAFHH